MIRDYEINDIKSVIRLGFLLHNNFKFDLNLYSKCKVLEIDDNVVGFITYSIIYERCEIIDIIVDDSFRSMGYGCKLLNEVINEAILKKCSNITLEVNVNNYSAISFYKKNNFNIVTTRKNYYKNEDAYLMLLSLEVIK